MLAFPRAQAQQSSFIIGGDWIRHPPVFSNDAGLSAEWWRVVRDAGFDRVFFHFDRELPEPIRIREMAAAASSPGISIALGHAEAGPAQDYALFTRGRRWRYHPEDELRFPDPNPPLVPRFFDAYAEQDAFMYGTSNYNCRHGVNGDSGMVCSGTIGNILYPAPAAGTPTLPPYPPEPFIGRSVTVDSLFYLRIRMRVYDPNLPAQTALLRVRLWNSGTNVGNPEIDHVIRVGVDEIRRSTMASNNQQPVLVGADDKYGEVLVGSWLRVHPGTIDDRVYVEVQHLGNAELFVDYLAIDDADANVLFSGGHDLAIDERRFFADTYANISMLKTADEPEVLQWPLVGYLEDRYSSPTRPGVPTPPSRAVPGISWTKWDCRGGMLRAALEKKQQQLTIDPYMFFYSPGRWTDTVFLYQGIHDTSTLQDVGYGIQEYGITPLRYAATLLRDFPDLRERIPNGLWSMVQLHRWEMGAREPCNAEIRLSVNLALTYGAKSIWYYPLHFADSVYRKDQGRPGAIGLLNAVAPESNVPSPRTVNVYGEDKYHFVRDLNDKLHVLGAKMQALTWDSAMSTHEWGVVSMYPVAGNTPRTPRFAFYDARLALADVTVQTLDAAFDTNHRTQYLEIGAFHGPVQAPGYAPHYLFVTNRRMTTTDLAFTNELDGTRIIGLEFTTIAGSDRTVAVEDGYTGDIDVYTQGSTAYPRYTRTLPPGEGVLLQIDTGRWVANRSLGAGQTLRVHAGATLKLEDMTLTLNQGATLEISGTMRVGSAAHLVLNGGTISFLGGELIIGNRDGLSGVGEIQNPNLALIDSYLLPVGSRLTLSGGGVIGCFWPDGGIYLLPRLHAALNIAGTLEFTGGGARYQFASCVTSITVTGRLESTTGVMLDRIPNLTGHPGSVLRAWGDDDQECVWRFRQDAECNVYGHLEANLTTFEGGPEDTVRWAGVLVAYQDSRIELDDCTVRDILVTPPRQSGAAIHLYASGARENRISSSHISRATTDNPARLGDGIFLQPCFDGGQQDDRSYLRLLCSTIDSSWWTAVANVGSDVEMVHDALVGNRVGTSISHGGRAMLHGTWIRETLGGCGVTVEDGQLEFGDAFLNTLAGENRIENNDSLQLRIGAFAEVRSGNGMSPQGELFPMNVLTHPDPMRQRLSMSPWGGFCNIRETWWGVVPDSLSTEFTHATQARLFGDTALASGWFEYRGALIQDPLLTAGPTGCASHSPLPPPVLQKVGSLATHATCWEELPRYAAANNFQEVYRFLGDWVLHATHAEASARAAALALALERRHGRTHPDSSSVCLTRLNAFVQARRLATTQPSVLADLLGIQARAALAFGGATSAELYFGQLRTQYPTSRAAHSAVPYLLQLAMARRDSVGMEAFVAEMEQAGAPPQDLALGYGLRRGYLRALPRAQIARARLAPTPRDTLTGARNPLRARCHPNPFNPSVTIAYDLPEGDHVTVCVHAFDGRRIATLVDSWQDAGAQRTVFEAPPGLSSGTYFYTISTSTLRTSGQMRLLR